MVRKDDPQLRDAVVAALESLIADGTYHKIFAKWGLTDNEVKQITVNDAGRWKDYLKLDE